MRALRKAADASGNLLKLIPAKTTTLDGQQVPVKRSSPATVYEFCLVNTFQQMGKSLITEFILMNLC